MFIEGWSVLMPFKLITGPNVGALQQALRDLAKGIKNVDRCLQIYGKTGGDFLLGQDFSTAECMTAPFIWRSVLWLKEFRDVDFKQLAVDLGCVRFVRWVEAVLSRPSVISTSEPVTATGIKTGHPEWFSCDEKLSYTVSESGELVF
eukprot:TRINITY_DN56863_c0_g1_i1.p2 TRINITY_DN56863_c0_g1~~TRINITY_DN56863_c0_g1_i1.p2  ORF type:complete len:147 (-),score=24.02 TRINITY_DN56863_c0_g1_i1:212-652(-)